MVSWKVLEPLGQRVPSLIGLRSSPSISIICPSLTYIFWAQPTAQYGHTPLTATASRMRECLARESGLNGWGSLPRRKKGLRLLGWLEFAIPRTSTLLVSMSDWTDCAEFLP